MLRGPDPAPSHPPKAAARHHGVAVRVGMTDMPRGCAASGPRLSSSRMVASSGGGSLQGSAARQPCCSTAKQQGQQWLEGPHLGPEATNASIPAASHC